jgi:hypothetical protein
MFKFDDRELAFMVLDNHHHDYDAQLRAIHDLLSANRRDAQQFSERIRELEGYAAKASGEAADHAVDETIDHYHHSVYRDAAHSMAAVGMLAPFVESLFLHAFQGIEGMLTARGLSPPGHPRWSLKSQQRWDCHFDQAGGRDIAKGIPDLADAIGLSAELPTDLPLILAALFRYRNAMFHEGFEWSEGERGKIAMATVAWPAEWFSQASSGGEPWVFYLTDGFADHVLATVERTLEGIGRFVRPHF